ncbi:MAG: hypothetical protein ABH879_03305 [archaeon]
MPKKSLILIMPFFLLVLLDSACAAQLYSNWTNSGKAINLGGDDYTITIISGAREISVEGPSETMAVPHSDCGRLDDYRFCYSTNKTTYSYAEKRDIPQVFVEVAYAKAAVSFGTRLDTNNPLIYEEPTVIVTISNQGDIAAENFHYFADLPFGVVYRGGSSPHLALQNNRVSWRGPVPAKSGIQFSYQLGLANPDNVNLTSRIEHGTDGVTTSDSDTLLIKMATPLSIVLSSAAASYGVGETIILALDVTNNYEDKIIQADELRLSIPNELEYVSSTPELLHDDNGYYVQGNIGPGETKKYSITALARRRGDITLMAHISKLRISGIELDYMIGSNLSLLVKTTALIPTLQLSGSKYYSGDTGNIMAYLKNADEFAEFTGIAGTIKSTHLVNKKFTVPEIAPDSKILVMKLQFQVPMLTETLMDNVSMTGTYRTAYGEALNFSVSEKVELVPQNSPVKITKTIVPARIGGSENTTIKVWVENLGSSALKNVEVTDEYPPHLRKLFGKTSAVISLGPHEKTAVYQYYLEAPMRIERNNNSIITTAKLDIHGYPATVYATESLWLNGPLRPALDFTAAVPSGLETGIAGKISFAVENLHTESISDVNVQIPYSRGIEYIDRPSVRYSEIPAGEKRTFSLSVRVNQPGNLVASQASVYYRDIYGNPFNQSLTIPGMTAVQAISNMSGGPLIIVDRRAEHEEVPADNEVNILIGIQNIGDAATDVKIDDQGHFFTVLAKPGEQRQIKHSVSFASPGEYILDPALISYSSEGKEYVTITDELRITVTAAEQSPEKVQAKAPAQSSAPDTTQPAQSAQQQNPRNLPDATTAEDGFFSSLLSGIMGFFESIF